MRDHSIADSEDDVFDSDGTCLAFVGAPNGYVFAASHCKEESSANENGSSLAARVTVSGDSEQVPEDYWR